MIGDQQTDIELAERIGATAFRIRPASTGAGAVDLWQAAQWILERSKQAGQVEES